MGESRQNQWKWLSTDEATSYLGVSAATLYRLVDEGRLPAYRPSRSLRFRLSDLEAFLENVKVRPGALAHLRSDAAGRDARRRRKTPDPASP